MKPHLNLKAEIFHQWSCSAMARCSSVERLSSDIFDSILTKFDASLCKPLGLQSRDVLVRFSEGDHDERRGYAGHATWMPAS